MPAKDVEFVTWTGDSDTADRGKRPCPCSAYPKMHLQWICTGWLSLSLFKTNRKKEIHEKNYPLKLTLRPCCHLPGSEHRATCASPGMGTGPARGGGVPPGGWEVGGEVRVLAVLDPALSCCRLIWEQNRWRAPTVPSIPAEELGCPLLLWAGTCRTILALIFGEAEPSS